MVGLLDFWTELIPLPGGKRERRPLSLNSWSSPVTGRTRPCAAARYAFMHVEVKDTLETVYDALVGQST